MGIIKSINKLAAASLAVLFLTILVYAAPHNGDEFELLQPDGSLVPVIVWGDEFYQTVESPDGYTLMRDADGWIVYAELSADGKDYVSTGIRYLGSDAGLSRTPVARISGKHLRRNNEEAAKIHRRNREIVGFNADEMVPQDNRRKRRSLGSDDDGIALAPPPPEVRKVVGLTIVVNFSAGLDHQNIERTAVTTGTTRQIIDDFCNKTGVTASIRAYYQDASNGYLDYRNIVPNFVLLPKPKHYYDREEGSRATLLINDAIAILQQQVNAGQLNLDELTLDGSNTLALNILYAGTAYWGWAKGLWPHAGTYSGGAKITANGKTIGFSRYQITSIGTGSAAPNIGTFVHETGHMLMRWPDLYPYDNSTNYVSGYCSMSSQNSTNPQIINPLFRDMAGWIEVTDITGLKDTVLRAAANSHTAFNFQRNDNESYYIEARRKSGRSAAFPGEGLFIWHAHKAGDNVRRDPTSANQAPFPQMAIMQANLTAMPQIWLNPPTNTTRAATPSANAPFRAGGGSNNTAFHGTSSLRPIYHGTGPFNGAMSDINITQISAAPTDANMFMTFRVNAHPNAHTILQNVPYIDANGAAKTANNVILINSANIANISNLNGWYLVRGNLTRTTMLKVSGTANVILENGSSLTITGNGSNAAINVPVNYNLEIFAQTPTTGATGRLTANGGNRSAGIGGNDGQAGGNVTITGGIISATGGANGAGIGGGRNGAGGNLVVSNGTLTATGGTSALGIGRGSGTATSGTFTMDRNGVVSVAANAIGDTDTGRRTRGILFVGNTGTFYGDSVVTHQNTTFATSRTLTVAQNKVLTLAKGTTLTNNGTVTNNGKINHGGTEYGTWAGNSYIGGVVVTYTVTFNTNGGSAAPAAQTVEANSLLTQPTPPTRAAHIFSGWWTAQTGGTQWNFATSKVTATATLWARWTPLSQNIDLSITTPEPTGIGWTYDATNRRYNILDNANVNVLGQNASRRRLVVTANATATITLNDVIIDELNGGDIPLVLNNGANVTLALNGKNTLIAGSNDDRPAIAVTGSTTTLTITGTGSLVAKGSTNGAGIGGRLNEPGGTVIIKGGVSVEAIGGTNAQGIGRGSGTAAAGSFTIDDGAIVYASNIGDTNLDRRINGILFINNAGTLCGNSVALSRNLTVSAAQTLNIPLASTLTVEGMTLTNEGTINGCGNIIGTVAGKAPAFHTLSDWGDWEITLTPTCTETGSQKQTRICAAFGCEHIEDNVEELPENPDNHDIEWLVSIPASCTGSGLEEGICTLCEYEEKFEPEPLGHDWDEEVITDDCATKTCVRCNETDNQCTGISKTEKYDGKYGIKFAKNIVSDKAEISVILPNDEKAIKTNFEIYDNVGNIVFRMGGNELKNSQNFSIFSALEWNLTNSAGRFVANGTYLVVVEVKSQNGNVYRYSARLGVKRN